jgi:hypothetical protein
VIIKETFVKKGMAEIFPNIEEQYDMYKTARNTYREDYAEHPYFGLSNNALVEIIQDEALPADERSEVLFHLVHHNNGAVGTMRRKFGWILPQEYIDKICYYTTAVCALQYHPPEMAEEKGHKKTQFITYLWRGLFINLKRESQLRQRELYTENISRNLIAHVNKFLWLQQIGACSTDEEYQEAMKITADRLKTVKGFVEQAPTTSLEFTPAYSHDSDEHTLYDCIPGGTSPEQFIQNKEAIDTIVYYLRRFPDTVAVEAFIMKFIYGQSYKEIARLMGFSDMTASRKANDCLNYLKSTPAIRAFA